MWKDSLSAGVMCLCLVGCATEPRLLDDLSDQTNLISNRIVLIAHSQNADARSQYHWTLQKEDKSTGWVYHESGGQGTTTSYEFAAGIHEELLAKLEEVRFFRMQSAYWKAIPSQAIGAPRATIEIHYHGRKHVVTQTGGAEIDDGFNKMWLFLGDVQRRSTVVSTKTTPVSGIGGRTSERLGGVITGLTPAGTP